MVPEETLRLALGRTLGRTDFPWLGARYEGKVRDNYTTADGRRYLAMIGGGGKPPSVVRSGGPGYRRPAQHQADSG